MPSNRIILRDVIKNIVATLPGFSPSVVNLYKLDRVDRTPSASVYLGSLTSNLEDMTSTAGMNNFERRVTVIVDLHLDNDASNDADTTMDGWLVELEQKILSEARAGNIGGIRYVTLDRAEFRPTQTSKERRGDLVTQWSAEYDECVQS